MKTKFKSILALAVLMICMSSCVYSLFPIYTEDTLVYLPELEGKWRYDNDPDNYMLFERGVDSESSITINESSDYVPENGVKITKKSFSIEYDGDEYIIEDGDTIRDPERVKAFYEAELSEAMDEFEQALQKKVNRISRQMKRVGGPRSASRQSTKDSYKLTVKDDDQMLNYEAHLVRIGDDLFMDLYATDGEHANKAFTSMVWFPVHTFMKVEIDGDQLRMIHFDLDKLNKLFESNLIRIDHENVDGTVLITAQPKEIQKFLARYSKDESVFDNVEVYNREAQ